MSGRHWLRMRFLVVVGVAFAFYLALLPHWMDRLDPLTGDEPFYVMTAISMIRDRDLNEINNYDVVTAETDAGPVILYRFDDELNPPEPLPPDWNGWQNPPRLVGPHAATTDRDGYYTKHGLGLSFLIAVPFEAAGRLGAVLVVVLLGSLLAGQMYLLAVEAGLAPGRSQWLALGLAVTMPLGPYALLIFPEIPAALMMLYAVRRISLSHNATHQWVLTGLSIGALPWMHQRFAVSAAVLTFTVVVLLVRRRSIGNALAVLPPIAALGLLLIGYNLWLYGSLVQPSADHAGFHGPLETLNAAGGLLLDAQWGLLIAAPIMLIALAAVPDWIRRAPSTALLAIAAAMPYLATLAAYRVWWGEWGPPARYLVPLVPLAAGTLAAWMAGGGRLRVGTVSAAWGAGLILTLLGYVDPQRFYHHPDGVNNLVARLDDLLGSSLQNLLVSFQPFAESPLADRLWIASFALILFLILVAVFNRCGLPRPFTERIGQER